VFDKTGTLTWGRPRLVRDDTDGAPRHLAIAAALAVHSRHPHCRALAAAQNAPAMPLTDIREYPGYGIEGRGGADVFRLGAAAWVLDEARAPAISTRLPHSVLSRNGALLAVFQFEDQLRPGAGTAIAALKDQGCGLEILSGDHAVAVGDMAHKLGVARFESGMRPGDKLKRLAALAVDGRKTLMVGDGLNDAPALAAAHVSMAPSSAVDVGRNAADFVFLRDTLEAVPFALVIARRARGLIRQNFALAVLYNAAALPFAIGGLVTPLAAALAMSASSILVVVNAMRLNGGAGAADHDAKRGRREMVPLAGSVVH